MLDWFGSLAAAVLAMGYLGVYIALIVESLGLPFPGDLAMAFYGFAAARGDMNLLLVLVFSVAGYLTGAYAAYLASRRFGAAWFDRVRNAALFGSPTLFNARSMMRTTRLIDRYGPWLLMPGRFLPGIRSVSSYVAGISRMDVQPFLLYTGIGVVLWCAAWIGIGYWFGDHMQTVIRFIQSSLAYTTAALLVVALCAWWVQKSRAR